MPTLAELKESSPAYASMSDQEFAERVYRKHYADKMSFGEFSTKTGHDRGQFARASANSSETVSAPAPTWVEREAQGLGVGARSVLQGSGGLLGAFGGDAFNKLIPGEQPSYRDAAGMLADKIGLPRASTPGQRIAADVGEGITGTALTMGAGAAASPLQGLVGNIGRFFSAQPGLQTVSTVTGTGAQSTAREMGATETQSGLAGLLGGFAPAGAGVARDTGLRALFRGTSPDKAQGNIAAFYAGGTTPSVGQASEGRISQGIETYLSSVPGGAGPMAAKATSQAQQVGSRLEDLARGISPKGNALSAEQAGRSIERGITGPGGFMERFRSNSAKLYEDVDRYIPPGTKVPAQSTTAYLASQAQPVQGASATSALLSNPKLAGIRQALEQDMAAGGGSIPYDALKQLRSKVGEMIGDVSLVSDIPTRQLRQLYGALSDDMREAVKATGNTQALHAFERANGHHKAGMKRLESIEHVLEKNGGPEAIFNAAFSGTKDGATTLRAVMQSLSRENQLELTSAFVRRLGKATNSQQNDIGDAFSMSAFLTNWNKVSPEARRTMFDRVGPAFSKNMDKIAKMASNVRDGSGVFANPSGTAARSTLIGSAAGTAGTIGTLLAMGKPGYAAMVGGAAIGGYSLNNWLARKMTDPKFVGWLAHATELPMGAIPAQAAVLRRIGESEEDPGYQELAAWLEENGQNAPNH